MSNQEKGRLRIRAAALNTMPNDVRSIRLRCIDFLEQRLEFGSTPVDTALDRSHRKTRNLCDLLVGQLLDITQKKLECFCFEQQILKPGEEALLPVILIFDKELPDNNNNIVLSYTIFDVTEDNLDELASYMHEHGEGHHSMGS